MQHRPEDFAFQLRDPFDLDQRRWKETAIRASRGKRKLENRRACGAHAVDVRCKRIAGLRVDHRADVGV